MESIQKPLRPKPGKTNFWKKRIQSELIKPANLPMQEGPWDPYNHFKEPQQLNVFFSGFPIRMGRRNDRMVFAQWAIEEVLRAYSPGLSQTPPTIADVESIASTAMTAISPRKILEAIRADAQRDIDADDHSAQDHACEVIHTVNSLAQTLVAASPNSLGPPIEPCVKYLRMEKCGSHGHNKLTVWRSPFFPRVDGRAGGKKGFLDNQVTSIVWILSRFLGYLPPLKATDPLTDEPMPELEDEETMRSKLRAPKYSGAILADSMGLGKTLSCIACLELMAGHKLNVVRERAPRSRRFHRPMAILAPNATVAAQWIEEICQSTDPEKIVRIITSGNGLQFRKHHSGRVRALNTEEFAGEWPDDVSYVWDDRDKRASKTVIVMSIDTFSNRTVDITTDALGQASYTSTFTELGRKFSVVVVDEAHKVKNDTTRNWKSVFLLDRQFTLLVTATPAINSLTDLMGLARLLWPAPSEYLKTHKPETWRRMENTIQKLHDLPYIERTTAWDDMRLVAGRPGLLARMLCRNRGASHDIQQIRDYLKYFESLAILRRSPSSTLFMDWEKTRAVSLEGLLPKVGHTTHELQLDPKLANIYQTVHATLLGDYVKVINTFTAARDPAKKTKSINSITSTHRLLQIASASVGVYRLDNLLSKNKFGTNASHITVMRRARVTLRALVQFMLEPYDPRPETALSTLKIAVRYSPVLRYILHDIQENILAGELKAREERREGVKIKKLLITEASPILAYFYELVLQFLGFNCRTFHADLSQEARRELAANFNSDEEDSCQILIQMYTVGFAGANLHRNCSRVLVASQASSLPVQWQAVHRVIRVGQTSDVQVTRVKVWNSYHAFRESRQIEKLLPELGARAQGPTNDVLVGILNLFQHEVDAAWESTEARKLVADMSVLLDEFNSTRTGRNAREQSGSTEPAGKQRKLNNGSALSTDGQDEEPGDDIGDDDTKNNEADTGVPTPQPQHDPKPGTAGWLCQDPEEENPNSLAAFLALKTRNEYYAEFKKLPQVAKSYFSHKKNNLRRILSFGNVSDGNKTSRVWCVDDLVDPAVLERAVELMLRVRLGAGPIEMLPLPQIDFSLAEEEARKVLQKHLAKVQQTDQDVEAAREQLEGSGRRGVKETLPEGLSIDAPMIQIEEAFDQDARHGGITATQQQRINTRSGRHINAEAENEDRDEDDGEAEGEGEDIEMLDATSSSVNVKEEDEDEDDTVSKRKLPQASKELSTTKERIVIVIDDDEDEPAVVAKGHQPQSKSRLKRESRGLKLVTQENGSDAATGVDDGDTQNNVEIKAEVDTES